VKKYFIFSILFLIIDRAFKYLSPSINFGGDFLQIGFYPNYSGAFSLPISGTLYNLAGITFLGIFIYLFIKELKSIDDYNLQLIAYSYIILGGASNIFDRLAYGYVIDYCNFMDFSFFNIADGILILGIILLLIAQIKDNIKGI